MYIVVTWSDWWLNSRDIDFNEQISVSRERISIHHSLIYQMRENFEFYNICESDDGMCVCVSICVSLIRPTIGFDMSWNCMELCLGSGLIYARWGFYGGLFAIVVRENVKKKLFRAFVSISYLRSWGNDDNQSLHV